MTMLGAEATNIKARLAHVARDCGVIGFDCPSLANRQELGFVITGRSGQNGPAALEGV